MFKAGFSYLISDPFQCVIPQDLYNDDRIHELLLDILRRSSLPDLPITMVPKAGANIGAEDEGRVLLPVVAASRAHSDISAALSKAKISECFL